MHDDADVEERAGAACVGRTARWYKDAVIYQVHVHAFFDSNDDGVGDFRGLISRLDYIADLGADAIWRLPFYPSPLRDDGYDISDYKGINPAYGTLEDFRDFVEAAHARGIRVIVELVVNPAPTSTPGSSAPAARRRAVRSATTMSGATASSS
jgi:maltose alpha-D-glucosyltransferase/alpha-amylase